MTHSMLAMTMSKKISIRDPQAQSELKVYVAVLAALLIVRIPLVRQLLMQIPILLKRARKSVTPVAAQDREVELWPKIHGRESSVSVEPTFIIISNQIPNLSKRSSLGKPFRKTRGPLKSYDDDLSVEIPTKTESEIQEAVI